jgi:RecA-family ATPase
MLWELDRPSWRLKKTPLWDRLVLRCRRTGIQLVIIDTVSRTFGGVGFIERHVIQFIDEMLRLAEAIRGVVLLLQHPSQAGRKSGTGMAGSTQWEDAVRSRLYVHKHDALGLVIEGMKANYSGNGNAPPLKIEWQKGVFVPVAPSMPRDYSEARGGG